MRLRISLRGLLVLTACVAVACWWLDRPRQVMDRFVAAVEAGDYNAVRSMIDVDHASPRIRLPDEFADQGPRLPYKWGISRREPTILDWLQGRRRISVSQLNGPAGCSNTLIVTASGIRRP